MTSYNDRVEGVLLATAAGDALGAPYEFKPPRGPELEVAMVGGGPWERGEWTDDTSMAIAIAEVAATGADLRDSSAQDAIVQRWYAWSRTAKDVGIQTGSVLTAAARNGVITAANARAESAKLYERTGRAAGNGSLMRTAPVALAYLDDEDAMVEAARAISELTHFDPDAGDACVLWCSAIRHAVLTGELDVRIGMRHIESGRRDLWSKRLDAAESARPASFANNGWVVAALQAAWSAIATTPVPVDDPDAGVFRADHLGLALDAAVRAGLRHRHGGGDRGRPARCGVRRFRGSGPLALPAARLAGYHRPWTGGDLRRPSSARGSRMGSTSPTRVPRSTPSRATHTTKVSCSAASAYFAGSPRMSTRSFRCAGLPTRTFPTECLTSKCD